MRTARGIIGSLLLGTALGATMVAGPATAARAAGGLGPGSVTVFATSPDTIRLTLLGATSSGYAVSRNFGDVIASPGGDSPFAGSLLPHNVDFHNYLPQVPYDVYGDILRWGERRAAGGWVIHRQNVYGGAVTDIVVTDEPLAFTPDGYIGYADGVLRRHVFGGVSSVLLTGVEVSGDSAFSDGAVSVDADATGAVVTYLTTVNGQPRGRLGLVTFGQSGISLLVDEPADGTVGRGYINKAVLTPSSVVWSTTNMIRTRSDIHRRPRSGGAVSSVATPVVGLGAGGLAASDSQVAATEPTGSGVRVLRGTTWRTITPVVTAPAYVAEIVAVGDEFAFAVSGDDGAQGGVHRFGTGSVATRVATPPTGESRTVTDVSLSNGRLTYGVQLPSAPEEAPADLRRVGITTTGGVLGLGPNSPINGGAVHLRGAVHPGLSVSGERAVLRTYDYGGETFTKYAVTGPDDLATAVVSHPSTTDQRVRMSGAYALVDSRVVRADRGDDQAPLLDLRSQKCSGTDIFGSLVVCARPNGSVGLWDVSKPGAEPVSVGGGATGPVAIWGTRIAYRIAGGLFQLTDLSIPGTQRRLDAPGTVRDLRLSEGALSWFDGRGHLMVVDLGPASTNSPVDSGVTAVGEVDDHLVAGLAAPNQIKVRTLPFGLTTPYRPRLIDQIVPGSFRPADGAWSPVFDATKPLTSVRVQIKKGGTPVVTLTGTAVNGGVTDLHWDGRTSSGAQAAAGAYTWSFSAAAADGEGALVNVDGASPIGGTVYLVR